MKNELRDNVFKKRTCNPNLLSDEVKPYYNTIYSQFILLQNGRCASSNRHCDQTEVQTNVREARPKSTDLNWRAVAHARAKAYAHF